MFTALLCPHLSKKKYILSYVLYIIYIQHDLEQRSNQPQLKTPLWAFNMTCCRDRVKTWRSPD